MHRYEKDALTDGIGLWKNSRSSHDLPLRILFLVSVRYGYRFFRLLTEGMPAAWKEDWFYSNREREILSSKNDICFCACFFAFVLCPSDFQIYILSFFYGHFLDYRCTSKGSAGGAAGHIDSAAFGTDTGAVTD